MENAGFGTFAQYLGDPLVLTGFGLFLFFGFARSILNSGLLRQVNQGQSFDIIKRLILLGFVSSLVLMVLAFGLKYNRLSKSDQARALSAICSELVDNRQTTGELAGNLTAVLNNSLRVATALREDGDGILRLLFPWENIENNNPMRTPLSIAEMQLVELERSGLQDDDLQRSNLDQQARIIASTIKVTRTTFLSLMDVSQDRYVVFRDAWKANQPITKSTRKILVTCLRSTVTLIGREVSTIR